MPRNPALVLVTLVALAPACGHRGDPLPPRRRTPPAPHDFRVAQRGNVLEARATAPTASVDGIAYEALTVEFLYADGLKDLEKAGSRLAVQAVPGARATGSLPLPAPGTTLRVAARGIARGEKGARTLTLSFVAQAPLDPPSELRAVIAADGIALSWHGVRPKAIVPPTPAPFPGAPALPGAPRPPGAPPQPTPPTTTPPTTTPPTTTPPASAPAPNAAAGPAPAAPATTPAAPPVLAPPTGAGAPSGGAVPGALPAPPEGPRRHGFVVYRRTGNEAYGEALIREPLDERSLVDPSAPLGATACYVVRAVASTDPLVESAPSNEACVDNRDITAPAAPAGLAVLPREGGLEILWGPSADADVAGYRIYRTAAGGPRERLAEVGTNRTAWLDETARPGVAYAYSVAVFDAAGNESAAAEPVEASLP